MKKVKFFASYCDDEQIYKNIISSWGMGTNTYKDIFITKEDDYEYAVIFNGKIIDKKLPKENVIGFSHEPRMTLGLNPFIETYIKDSVSEYYLSNTRDLSLPFKEGFSFVCPYEYGKSRNESYERPFRMSMILSMSNFMPGHNLRHLLLNRILNSDMDIHFYANGLNKVYSDPRVKEFDWDVFGYPYENYEYQIVIENVVDNHWSSEKLTNCVIKETIPIYYGSKNCSSIFYPGDSINHLTNDIQENFEIISEIYNNGVYDSSLTRKAKDKLYKEVNLLEFLNEKFK